MKKKYEKLCIKVEEFNVIQAVSSCNVSTTMSMPLNCAEPEDDDGLLELYYGYPEVFTNICEIDLNDFPYYSYCYHTPTGSFVVFSS